MSTEAFQDEWAKRIIELDEAVTQDTLQPYHLRWIELLSHSVNLPKLIEKIKTAPVTTSESSMPIMKESIKASGLKLNPMPVDTGTDNVVEVFGREISISRY